MESDALSRGFLPPGFDPKGTLGLIAGRGRYPMLTAEGILRAGVPLRLIALEGETDPAWVESIGKAFPWQWMKVGQLGRLLKGLKAWDCRYAMMVGQVTPGKLFRGLHPDFKALQILLRLKRRNADTLFGAVADEMEQIGVTLLDARAFMQGHLATPGEMTKARGTISADTVEWAGTLARQLAGLDVGQSAVVSRGTVIAVEAFEGTDATIERAAKVGAPAMTLVKAAKPGKDMRFDVPVFGERTLRKMHEGGLRAALLEAHRTLILDKPKVLQQAREWKIRLYGYE